MLHPIKMWKKWLLGLGLILLFVSVAGCQTAPDKTPGKAPAGNSAVQVTRGQNYSTRDEVAAYIHQFRVLPPNFITKAEAQKLGWDNAKGNLWKVTDRKSIGGDRFGNREGQLPTAGGRQYYECDIDYSGGYRGAKRIIYSNDGLIFYTDDHYKTFRQLYQGAGK